MPKFRARKITINNAMQRGYTYVRTEPEGKNFDPRFRPDLTPKEMLALGVFGGLYLNDCQKEYPKTWFRKAKLQKDVMKGPDPKLNFFKIKASQSLAEWQRKGWIYKDDPRGWFEWYARYYMGRRIPDEDERQIKRWLNMRRHIMQIKNNCLAGDISCRRRQRQALLHWAYDSRKM